MHICVSNLTIIGSDNGLSPGRRLSIIWTNAEILLIGPFGTHFSEILIEICIIIQENVVRTLSAIMVSAAMRLNEPRKLLIWNMSGNVWLSMHTLSIFHASIVDFFQSLFFGVMFISPELYHYIHVLFPRSYIVMYICLFPQRYIATFPILTYLAGLTASLFMKWCSARVGTKVVWNMYSLGGDDFSFQVLVLPTPVIVNRWWIEYHLGPDSI